MGDRIERIIHLKFARFQEEDKNQAIPLLLLLGLKHYSLLYPNQKLQLDLLKFLGGMSFLCFRFNCIDILCF
jgi:hypothetical protein